MRLWRIGLVAGALALSASGCTQTDTTVQADRRPIVVRRLARYQVPTRTEVHAGDTIESVCRRLAGDDWVLWRDALVAALDPRRLLPGTTFEGRRSAGGRLERLVVQLDRRASLRLAREAEGIRLQRIQLPIESVVRRLEGVVTSSLFAAVESAGGRPELAVRLAEVFQWDIDFFRDLRQGDRFVAVVESQRVAGEFYGYGELFAARFVNGGRTLDAVLYPDSDGRLGYYDLEGRPLRKMFLRSPLTFSRITSRFSMSRVHPVLKRRIPHYGVDYGAPVGTPVHATADGVVVFTGVKGGAGRMVRIRHPNGYETSYLHLSRYASGVRAGARISQGAVIGFVGSSGLSTGPHLDYRVTLNGRWLNPLTISSPAVEPLDEIRIQRYLAHALAVLELLAGREPPAGAAC